MISFDGVDITFSNMGLFDTDKPWTHPKRIIDSYELIYCLEGSFYIIENNNTYLIKEGTLLFLYPDLQHVGFRQTTTPTKFYWLHFHCNGFEKLRLQKKYSTTFNNINEHIFRELSSLQAQAHNQTLLDIKLTELLIKLSTPIEVTYSKLFTEIKEYIRVNAGKSLTPQEIADKFKYSSGYLSRLFTKTIGIPLKNYIIEQRLSFIKSLLLNSNYSIKEVSDICDFWHENNFVKFFKYHTGITPSEYRNQHASVHINNH